MTRKYCGFGQRFASNVCTGKVKDRKAIESKDVFFNNQRTRTRCSERASKHARLYSVRCFYSEAHASPQIQSPTSHPHSREIMRASTPARPPASPMRHSLHYAVHPAGVPGHRDQSLLAPAYNSSPFPARPPLSCSARPLLHRSHITSFRFRVSPLPGERARAITSHASVSASIAAQYPRNGHHRVQDIPAGQRPSIFTPRARARCRF